MKKSISTTYLFGSGFVGTDHRENVIARKNRSGCVPSTRFQLSEYSLQRVDRDLGSLVAVLTLLILYKQMVWTTVVAV